MATREEIGALLARIALGDRAAFAALYRATSAKLYGITLNIVNDRAEAEEVLQATYVRIWRNAGNYPATGLSPMAWLIAKARQRAINRVRSGNGRGFGEMDRLADIVAITPSPEALAIAARQTAPLLACLASVQDGQAETIRLAYLQGESYDALAERFKVPHDTIRAWLRRGLMALNDCLTR